MSEEYPIRVESPDGKIVAACSEIETAIGLVCASGPCATIWMGLRNPQKIYTLSEYHASLGYWYGRWCGEFANDLYTWLCGQLQRLSTPTGLTLRPSTYRNLASSANNGGSAFSDTSSSMLTPN